MLHSKNAMIFGVYKVGLHYFAVTSSLALRLLGNTRFFPIRFTEVNKAL